MRVTMSLAIWLCKAASRPDPPFGGVELRRAGDGGNRPPPAGIGAVSNAALLRRADPVAPVLHHLGFVTREFLASNLFLIGVQAAIVALPRGRSVRVLERLAERMRSSWWGLIPVASVALVVWGVNAEAGTAGALTWLALIAIPPLAAVALGWMTHGARPWLAPLALLLFALAWADGGRLPGEGAATLLTALSCVTLGVLLVSVAPHGLLKAGIVVMAAVDAILIGANTMQPAVAVINAAAPAVELPQLQRAHFGDASIGYGDYFVAGVFGALVAAEHGRQARAALLVLAFALAFDLLFLVLDMLPATVPVALALLVTEAAQRRGAPLRQLRLSRSESQSG